MAILCIGSIGLFVAIIFGLIGFKLAQSKKKVLRPSGVVIILMSCALPFVVCSGFEEVPSRSELRNKIEKGMTKQEVIDVAGEPSDKGPVSWIYYTDFWRINFFGVSFGQDGRVDRTFID